MSVLCSQGVYFRYNNSNEYVLKNINFQIGIGERVLIYGLNGSGKSSLARLLAGLDKVELGSITLNGKLLNDRWNEVALLFQNPDLQILTGSVREELTWGLENLNVPHVEMKSKLSQTLETFGIEHLSQRSPNTLSDGEKQLLVLASLWIMSPKFLILDEGNTHLDPEQTQKLLSILEELSPKCGIVWLTSRIDSPFRAERNYQIKEGQLLEFSLPEHKNNISMNSDNFSFGSLVCNQNSSIRYEELILRDIRHQYSPHSKFLINIDELSLKSGELLFLSGRSASGKSTLAKIIKGLLKPQSGKFYHKIDDKSSEINSGDFMSLVGWCGSNPEQQFFAADVEEEIGFCLKNRGVSDPQKRELVVDAMNLVGLDDDCLLRRSPFNLSGGEKRRVAIASTIADEHTFYVFDEPLSGLDDRGIYLFFQLLMKLLAKGCGILWMENDYRLFERMQQYQAQALVND